MIADISPEELAAVICALGALAPREEPVRETEMPAWRRAMRDESVESF